MLGLNGRDVVLKSLVGSHNYNLANKESDRDFKVFVTPTFDELYLGQRYAKSIITPTEDNDIHDVRKLSDLLFKANINFLEVLSSNDLYIPSGNTEMHGLLRVKKDIFKMNLPHLFNACKGMHFNKMKDILKGTEGTQHLVDKYGYDTKQATHAMRVMMTPVRFEATNFEDFDGSIRFTGEELKLMLAIRHGELEVEEYRAMAKEYFDNKFMPLAKKYGEQKVNFELKDFIDSTIMKLIKRKLLTKA